MSVMKKKQWTSFDMPVSYRTNETRDRLKDSRNVYPNQGRLSTRYGARRYNSTSLGGAVLSSSFFKSDANSRYLLAKVSSSIYSVAASGAHTEIKSGLSTTTKHDGLTWNNRHIFAVEGDGLYQWNGTTFTQLGQDPPAAPTIAAQGTGLTDAAYTAVYTFYDSVNGFESNASAASNSVTTVSQGLRVTMATTAANGNIDKKRIYLKQGTGSYLFVAEIALATATYDITANPTSTSTPPTTHAAPMSGGGSFLVSFGSRLAILGNTSFPNDVQLSEIDIPDAVDDTATSKLFTVPGQGKITGGVCGYYNNSVMEPYLVIFKRTSTHLYSEIGGLVRFVTLNHNVGCVNHKTIFVKNGNIFFQSVNGWYAIVNGSIVTDDEGNPRTLGGGDVDDIFSSPGFVYEINNTNTANFHAAYFSKDDLLLNFISEGSSTDVNKCYAYSFSKDGFYPFEFSYNIKSSVAGEDSDGDECVFWGDSNGTFYKYCSTNDRTDTDINGTDVNIAAFAMLAWFNADNDFGKSYSFVRLIIKALSSSNSIAVKTWVNYVLDSDGQQNYTYEFPSPNSGFILDESILDVGILSDGRDVVEASAYLKRTGRNILLYFYQTAANASMEIIAAQLEYVSNGNRN